MVKYRLYDRKKAIKNKGVLDKKSYIGTYGKDTILKLTKGRTSEFSIKKIS